MNQTKVPNPVAAWEEAYLRFETPEEEVQKFQKRYREIGAEAWGRESEIVEIFCGRGGGLIALERMGFTRIEGVDLSQPLLDQYSGPAKTLRADCRQLPFADASKDIVVVQGGLHHLDRIPDDLVQVLAEVERVLRPAGRFVCVEPWLTPFLRIVHWVARRRLARRLSSKIDALQTMIVHEQRTYDQWLGQGPAILTALDRFFQSEKRSMAWGKLIYVGRRKRR